MAFFLLFAVDCWIQLGWASKVTASPDSFQLTQFGRGWQLWPSTAALVAWRVGTMCFAIVTALAPYSRWTARVVAAMWFVSWVSSQLDNYQHHYFLVLLTCLLACFDWPLLHRQWLEIDHAVRLAATSSRPEARAADLEQRLLAEGGRDLAPTAIPLHEPWWQWQLLRVQLSLLYFWTAVAKMHPAWLLGRVQQRMMSPWVADMVELQALLASVPAEAVWMGAGVGSVVVELALAAGHWSGRARVRNALCLLGVLFHIFLHVAGLQIGRFSHYMVLILLLVMPSTGFRRRFITQPLGRWVLQPVLRLQLSPAVAGGLAAVSAVVFTLVVVPQLRLALLDGPAWLGVVLLLLVGVPLLVVPGVASGDRHALSCLLLLYAALFVVVSLCALTSGALHDIHHNQALWLARSNQIPAAIEALERGLAVAPRHPSSWSTLGLFQEAAGLQKDALKSYHQALAVRSDDVKALMGLLTRAEQKRQRGKVCDWVAALRQVCIRRENQWCPLGGEVLCEDEKAMCSRVAPMVAAMSQEFGCN